MTNLIRNTGRWRSSTEGGSPFHVHVPLWRQEQQSVKVWRSKSENEIRPIHMFNGNKTGDGPGIKQGRIGTPRIVISRSRGWMRDVNIPGDKVRFGTRYFIYHPLCCIHLSVHLHFPFSFIFPGIDLDLRWNCQLLSGLMLESVGREGRTLEVFFTKNKKRYARKNKKIVFECWRISNTYFQGRDWDYL